MPVVVTWPWLNVTVPAVAPVAAVVVKLLKAPSVARPTAPLKVVAPAVLTVNDLAKVGFALVLAKVFTVLSNVTLPAPASNVVLIPNSTAPP